MGKDRQDGLASEARPAEEDLTAHVWMSLEEAAAATAKSSRTIRRWLEAGRLSAAYRDRGRPGEPWCIRADQLEDLAGPLQPPDMVSGHAPDTPEKDRAPKVDAVDGPVTTTESPDAGLAAVVTDLLYRLDDKNEQALAAQIANTEARARLDAVMTDLQRVTAQRDRAQSDLEQVRAEAQRSRNELEITAIEARERAAAADARVDTLAGELERSWSETAAALAKFEAERAQTSVLANKLANLQRPKKQARWWKRG